MALAAPRDEAPLIGNGYTALRLEWARQLRAYTHSVRLYQQAVVKRRAPRTTKRQRGSGRLSPPTYVTATVAPPLLGLVTPVEEIEESVPSVDAPEPGPEPSKRAARGPLTRRQLEIADLIAQGLTNAQIAEQLVLSRGTVGNHIGQMLRRLGVHNRAQIAAWMIRHSTNAG